MLQKYLLNTSFMTIRPQEIHWQYIPPVNGREFVASDVLFHCNRQCGLGGFTKPLKTAPPVIQYLTSVTTTDKYTVVVKLTISNPEVIEEPLRAVNTDTMNMEAPDAVQLWGDVRNLHHAIGTRPFILKDFVSDSSATLVNNPNYWDYDERYLQNQLPYIDTLNYLMLPNNATALATMRTGKIDVMDNVSLQDVQAMQMAIDLPTKTKKYYGGCLPDPSSLTSNYLTGWGFPSDQWPQSLKDDYAYNPTAARKLLAAAGYPNVFKTDVVDDITTDLNLLQIVQSYFADIGITMSIKTMDIASWTSLVQSKHAYDALAMKGYRIIGLGFGPTSDFVWYFPGTSADYAMVNDPIFNTLSAKIATSTSLDDFKEIIKEANQEVMKRHFSICLIQPNIFTLIQPRLKGYHGQDVAIRGTVTDPRLNGFYMARFGMDQNMKK